MKYNSQQLLDNVASDTRAILLQVEKLKSKSETELRIKAAPDTWSAAQVLQHLNFYCTHYLNEIEKAINGNQKPSVEEFKAGWLGNYFTNLMKLKPDGVVKKKMKSPKHAIPSEILDVNSEMNNVITHQHHFLNLLEICRSVNLNSVRIPTSLHSVIQLKLGDTLMFFNEHQKRHMKQINRVLEIKQ